MPLRPIVPLHRALSGPHVRVPASRSVANRELALSAIAVGTSHIDLGPLDPGDDVRTMRGALSALGYRIESGRSGVVAVTGSLEPAATSAVDAGDAGTVARFATGLAATGSGRATIDGSRRMRERPLAPLLVALRSLGARIDGDALPITVSGPLRGGTVEIGGSESSQFASALLLIAPLMPGGLRLRVTGAIVSAPFIELTITALEARGVRVERTDTWAYAIAAQRLHPRDVVVPGDLTAATYPAAAAALLGGSVVIERVDAIPRPGGQGDARFFSLLEEMGCVVMRDKGGVTVRREGALRGIAADVRDCSDVFPTLAAVAALASGPSEISGIAHTRRQESDRVAAVAAGLRALGGDVTEHGDALRIVPRPLRAGVVDAAGDHRMAMAFAVLGLAVPGVAIEGADVVSKTFPDFFALLAELSR